LISHRSLRALLPKRQVVLGFLRAMEGDVRLVGLTQKITGKVKSSAPGAASNSFGAHRPVSDSFRRFVLQLTRAVTHRFVNRAGRRGDEQ
jgi:hypothetical protein